MRSKAQTVSEAHQSILPAGFIERWIYLFRGHKVILSTHLAQLYEVDPRALVQAVKRNLERFPEDFMFQLTREEFAGLKSQFVTSSWVAPDARHRTRSPRRAWPCSLPC